MYVRKFEGDTLEETLKSIKLELGPDAIILKTITNKGLKGAFKKKKIEITAAIPEKKYSDKLKVDHVLPEADKDKFYSNDASYVSNMINSYSGPHDATINDVSMPKTSGRGYGSMGLNKKVSTLKDDKKADITSGLDAFLNKGNDFDDRSFIDTLEEKKVTDLETDIDSTLIDMYSAEHSIMNEDIVHKEVKRSNTNDDFKSQLDLSNQYADQKEVQARLDDGHEDRIKTLEDKLEELSLGIKGLERSEPKGIYGLRSTLKSLGIEENYIRMIISKSLFELSEDDLEDADSTIEFALEYMLKHVKCELPLFTSSNSNIISTITIMLSDGCSGQSSMTLKLASMKNNSIVIRANMGAANPLIEDSFTEKILSISTVNVSSMTELVSECRKANDKGLSVFIDFVNSNKEVNETKKFIDGIRRSFDKVEVLISLSAIHSELYNKKVISRYKTISDGILFSHLDKCIGNGSLFNIADFAKGLPLKLFGTGKTIPDDVEVATAERVLSGIFQL